MAQKKDFSKKEGQGCPSFFAKKSYIEILSICAVLAIAIGWFFKGALFSNGMFVERDLSRYYYPLREFAVGCIKTGVFPLWNPYIFCGNPLFATLQSSVIYPLSIIYYLGNFARMFNVFILAHFFLAGIFTYLFLRRMGYSLFAGFLSSAAFCFSGYLTSVINLLTTLSVVAWLPLAMLFYYELIKNIKTGRKGFKHAVFLGIVLTVMFLGGEPSVLYLIVGLFAIGSVYFFLEERIEKHRFNFYYFKTMLLAAAVFLGLSAFQLLPFWEFLKVSSRQMMKFEMTAIWNLPLKDTPGIILPFFHDIFKLFENYWTRQSWLDNYYVGILVFLLFIIGIIFDKSKKAKAIFIFGLVGFAFALGKDTVLFEFLYRFIPGFKTIRYSVRFFFMPTFAICVLAGMGLDYYRNFSKIDLKLKKTAFVILMTAFFSSIVFFIMHLYFWHCFDFVRTLAIDLARHSNAARLYIEEITSSELFMKFITIDLINLKRAFLLLVFFGLLFYLGTGKDVRTGIFVAPVLVFLAVSDVSQVNAGFSPLFDAQEFISPSANIAYLTKERLSRRCKYPGDLNKSLFRICSSPKTSREHAYVPEKNFYAGLQASKDRLINNRMITYGIYDVNMYGSVYIKRNSRFLNLVMKKKTKHLVKLLKLLNVRFVASSNDPKTKGFKLANKTGPANLYELSGYMERAFLAPKAVVITREEDIIEKLKNGDFEPEKEVILEEYLCLKGRSAPSMKPGGTRDAVKIVSYETNRVIIEANIAGEPKFLVLSDTYYPGWEVFVDGKIDKLLRANYIFRAVYLAPGRHTVKFVYSPFSFKIGVLISLATSLIILTFIVYNNIIKCRQNTAKKRIKFPLS